MIIGIFIMPVLSGAAPPVSSKTRDALIKQEVQQGNIGASLGRVAQQIDLVIAEYVRNGLEGDDVNTLIDFRRMLSNLSESESKEIVEKLRSARIIQDDTSKARTIAFGAYRDQKVIYEKLRNICDGWLVQEDLRGLSIRFNRLAGTQRGNMQRTVDLYKKHNF